MTREVLAFGPFLESLEHRLDELPAEQLRRVLLEHGARLPVGKRVGFLHVSDTSGTTTGHTTTPTCRVMSSRSSPTSPTGPTPRGTASTRLRAVPDVR